MSALKPFGRKLRLIHSNVRRRIGLFEGDGNGTVPRAMKVCTTQICRVCGKRSSGTQPFRIIYFAPAWDAPTGGGKVIYQHVEAIANQGTPCFLFHPEKPGSNYTWMPHHVQSLKAGHFDPRRDFLVFPEVWAALAGRFCIPMGFKYAIFVQNGYLTHRTAGFTFAEVVEAYRHATLVLSISDDTTAMLQRLFPFITPERIQRIYYSVPRYFAPSKKKESLITYMPRKLRGHAERLEAYLANCLPPQWRIVALDDLSARAVAAALSRSSIFLSLADLEGYPLPPLEAALCGNVVVGYTGQGAKEYFHRPAFREVPHGDFGLFVSEAQAAIRDVADGIHTAPLFLKQIAELAALHSEENEASRVSEFAQRALEFLGPRSGPIAAVSNYGT